MIRYLISAVLALGLASCERSREFHEADGGAYLIDRDGKMWYVQRSNARLVIFDTSSVASGQTTTIPPPPPPPLIDGEITSDPSNVDSLLNEWLKKRFH